jgi:hypothetical protein
MMARARWGPNTPGRVQGRSGECGEHGRGHSTGTGALEGGAPWRGGSTAEQLYSGEQSRTTEGRLGKIRGGCLPRGKASGPLNERQRYDEGPGQRW